MQIYYEQADGVLLEPPFPLVMRRSFLLGSLRLRERGSVSRASQRFLFIDSKIGNVFLSFVRARARSRWMARGISHVDELFYFIAFLLRLFPFFAAVYQARDPPGDANGRIC